MKMLITNLVGRVLLVGIAIVFFALPTGSSAGTVVAWGDNSYGLTNVPAGLGNVIAIAGGYTHNLVIRDDGTVVGWGDNTYGKVSGTVGLYGIVQVGAGTWHSIALRSDGQVIVWGQSQFGQTAIPVNVSNVRAIAAGGHHNLALTESGKVFAWGYNGSGEASVPSGLGECIAIAAGYAHSLALSSDGLVTSWGGMNQSAVPPGLTNVVAIAGGASHSLALKSDGTVVSWGSMTQGTVPLGLNNVVDIAAGNGYCIVLKNDGTIVSWGGQSTFPEGLTNVAMISAGSAHVMALVDSSAVRIHGPFGGRVTAGASFVFRPIVKGSRPLSYQWRKNGTDLLGQTDFVLALSNLQFADSGAYAVVVSNSFGSVTSRVARLSVTETGAPEIKADGAALFEDVVRGDQSTISISTPFPNGTIFYTLDGSAPDFISIPYVAPFVITQTTTVRAIAYSMDFAESVDDGPFEIRIVPTYSLTKLVGGQGTIFPELLQRYASRTEVTISAFPVPGWRFLRWEGDVCGSSASATVVMDTNKTVTAVFEAIPKYALNVTTAGGGTISGNTDSPYSEGSGVNLTAQPSAGWQFLRWEGDATGTALSTAVVMDRAKSVQAVFGTLVGTSGTVTLTPAQGPYPYGSTVRVWAHPNPGSYFAVWGSAGSGRTNPLSFVVTNANPTISALFVPLQGSDVNVYASVEGEGTVSSSPNLQPYSPGTPVTLTASPSPGWRFVQWQGDASGTSTNVTVVLNASKTVTAIFEVLPRFALATSTPGGGVIAGNTGSPYATGDGVNLTAQPATGWQFLGWQGDASGTTPNATVTMDQAKNVQAIFGTASVIINVVGPGTAMLNPAQGPYPYGSTVRLTATPNAGAYFATWGNGANGAENPLDYVVTMANPAICALFGFGENTAPPTVSVQPVGQIVVLGSNATFRVSAGGASPFAYQWRKNGIPIPGAASATYVISGVTGNDAGSFDVVISNSHGSITSVVATLTVVFLPTITVQPINQVVQSGTLASFSVTASGTEPVSYQWQTSAGPIADATNAVYTIDFASTNIAGDYFVLVSNPYGTATGSVVTLTVYVPVTITGQPAQQVVPLRGTATFSAAANGYPAPSYQWFFNGELLAGANGSSLVITNVGTNRLGEYSMIAWNAYSAATSSPAVLLMSPSIRAPFLGATVVWGKSATLTASAVGSGDLSYQWFKDGEAIPGATSATLTFPTIQLNDAGMYSLVAGSEWGSVTNTPAQLVVNPANISLAMYAGVTIDGVPGYTYGIQYTTDLRNTNSWVTVTNYTLSLPVETWIDMESAITLKRFYRVVAP